MFSFSDCDTGNDSPFDCKSVHNLWIYTPIQKNCNIHSCPADAFWNACLVSGQQDPYEGKWIYEERILRNIFNILCCLIHTRQKDSSFKLGQSGILLHVSCRRTNDSVFWEKGTNVLEKMEKIGGV